MKISEVTAQDLLEYLRIDYPVEVEIKEIEKALTEKKAYICSYTGLTMEELDEHEDITHALFLLVSDWYDNRNFYSENKASNENVAVKDILRMHSVNLL